MPLVVANQIAAGEVVVRPSSVVKELCDNALDAGAEQVRVEIAAGGIELVRVSDDGSGMSARDARLALERHATSKLRAIDDLATLTTLGFRGEALAAIASVSRFKLRTRRTNEREGVELVSEGGRPASLAPAGGAPGTVVEVRDLFFNVPARRKFLRATATESAHVGEVVMAAALAHPGVVFALARDGRPARTWLRAATRRERVRVCFPDVELYAFAAIRGPLGVEAYLSAPARARSGAGGLTLLVNGRAVQDRALARAVAAAYGAALEPGRYPLGVVYLDLPPALVDVNVHPQKSEVRFAEPRAVNDAVYAAIAAALPWAERGAHHRSGASGSAARSTEHIGGPTGGSGQATSAPTTGQTPTQNLARGADRHAGVPLSGDAGDDWQWSAPAPDAEFAAPSAPAGLDPHAWVSNGEPRAPDGSTPLRFVGTVAGRFVACEIDHELLLCTGHGLGVAWLAAALFARATGASRETGDAGVAPAPTDFAPERLLFPARRSLPAASAHALEALGAALGAVGLDVRIMALESGRAPGATPDERVLLLETRPPALAHASADALLAALAARAHDGLDAVCRELACAATPHGCPNAATARELVAALAARPPAARTAALCSACAHGPVVRARFDLGALTS